MFIATRFDGDACCCEGGVSVGFGPPTIALVIASVPAGRVAGPPVNELGVWLISAVTTGSIGPPGLGVDVGDGTTGAGVVGASVTVAGRPQLG